MNNYKAFFNTLICRPYFVFGKRQQASLLFSRLGESVLNGKAITLQQKEGIVINPIFVEDAAQAIVKAFESSNISILNIAGNQILTLKQIVDVIAKFYKVTPVYKYQDTEAGKLVAGISELKEVIRSKYQFTDFSEAVSKTFS